MIIVCWLTHWPFWTKLLGAWHRPALVSHCIGRYCPVCHKVRIKWSLS
jgi:hypothetical protein